MKPETVTVNSIC